MRVLTKAELELVAGGTQSSDGDDTSTDYMFIDAWNDQLGIFGSGTTTSSSAPNSTPQLQDLANRLSQQNGGTLYNCVNVTITPPGGTPVVQVVCTVRSS